MLEVSSHQLAVLGTAAVLVFWMVGAYNRLVALRGAIGSAWAQVDELLSRRRESVVPLLIALREPLGGEHDALDGLLAAQAQVQAAADAVRARVISPPNVAALAAAEGVLVSALARLRARVDHDEPLRQGPDIGERLRELHELDQRLAFARQAFNAAGQAYDEALRQFPTRLLRPLFAFEAAGRL